MLLVPSRVHTRGVRGVRRARRVARATPGPAGPGRGASRSKNGAKRGTARVAGERAGGERRRVEESPRWGGAEVALTSNGPRFRRWHR